VLCEQHGIRDGHLDNSVPFHMYRRIQVKEIYLKNINTQIELTEIGLMKLSSKITSTKKKIPTELS
jgi:hypothetical protein